MRKGLTVTLMTVVLTAMALQAMAKAPVITDIPSPVVSNEGAATSANWFVYPDAIDLSNYAADSDSPATDIRWSYYIEGTAKYQINGVDPLTSAEVANEDFVSSPTGKAINMYVLGGETNPDANAQTITIRNSNLNPLGGTAKAVPPTGVVDAETQVVTLFAADGTSYSSTDVYFYTESGGEDHLSQPSGVNVVNHTFAGSDAWGFGFMDNYNSISSSVSSGLCIEAAAAGSNMGSWVSGFGADNGGIPLVDNAVYKIRVTMNSTQADPNAVPLWDMMIRNHLTLTANDPVTGVPYKGVDAYGADFMFFCQSAGTMAYGAANALTSDKGNHDFTLVWAPAAVGVQTWRDTAFSTAWDPWNDAAIFFRVLDVDSTFVGNTTDSGKLCLTKIVVDRYDLGDLPVVAKPYEKTSLTSADLYTSGATTTTVGFASGVCTIQPTGASKITEYLTLNVGDTTNAFVTANLADLPDNYPVQITKADQVFKVTFTLSASTAASDTDPIDVFWVGADMPNNELGQVNLMTNAMSNSGMPKYGVQDQFISFFSGNALSTLSDADWQTAFRRFRPRFELGNNAQLMNNHGGAGTDPGNVGGVKVHGIKVEEMGSF